MIVAGEPTYASRRKFAQKAESKGGVLNLIFDYGVHLDELPPGDYVLRDLISELLRVEPYVIRLEQLLAEAMEDDD